MYLLMLGTPWSTVVCILISVAFSNCLQVLQNKAPLMQGEDSSHMCRMQLELILRAETGEISPLGSMASPATGVECVYSSITTN